MSPRRKPKGDRQGNRKATTRHGEADNRIVPLDNPSVHRSVGIPGGLGRSLEAPSTATMTGGSEEAGGAVHDRRETRRKVRNQGRTGHVVAWCAQSLALPRYCLGAMRGLVILAPRVYPEEIVSACHLIVLVRASAGAHVAARFPALGPALDARSSLHAPDACRSGAG